MSTSKLKTDTVLELFVSEKGRPVQIAYVKRNTSAGRYNKSNNHRKPFVKTSLVSDMRFVNSISPPDYVSSSSLAGTLLFLSLTLYLMLTGNVISINNRLTFYYVLLFIRITS